jgi:hypothetical protein
MGAAYPQPSPQLLLHHAGRLLETRALRQARAEYRELEGQLTGLERDQARVRIGEADFLDGRTATAYPYLRQLELPESEADAERLAYLVECTRHLTDDDEMKSTLERLAQHYPHSPWRLKALLSAANRFLLINRPDEFVPLYRAVYQDFPNAPEAALAHWKVTFQAYLHDDPQAQPLLMEHARNYPTHPTAGAALYFWADGSSAPATPAPLWPASAASPARGRTTTTPCWRATGSRPTSRPKHPSARSFPPVDTGRAAGAARPSRLTTRCASNAPACCGPPASRYRRFRTSLRSA